MEHFKNPSEAPILSPDKEIAAFLYRKKGRKLNGIFIHAEVDNDVTACGVSRYHARKAGGTILPPAAAVLETARAD